MMERMRRRPSGRRRFPAGARTSGEKLGRTRGYSQTMIARILVAAAMSLTALIASPPADAYDQTRVILLSHAHSKNALEGRGIPRFAEIEPGLTRGGQPTAEGLQFLRERGYRTVISFRRNSPERRALEGMGIRYVEIPMRAGLFGATPPTREDVARFLEVVSDSSQRPAFIHCRRGKDRTGAMAAIYRIEVSGWRNEDALREMLSFGFDRRYRKLMNYVRDYARGTVGGPTGP